MTRLQARRKAQAQHDQVMAAVISAALMGTLVMLYLIKTL